MKQCIQAKWPPFYSQGGPGGGAGDLAAAQVLARQGGLSHEGVSAMEGWGASLGALGGSETPLLSADETTPAEDKSPPQGHRGW